MDRDIEQAGTFPVLWQGDRRYILRLRELHCPVAVPWDFVAAHAAQCIKNHDQSPTRLAERGGLGPSEMIAVVEDRPFRSMCVEDGVAGLIELLADAGGRKR